MLTSVSSLAMAGTYLLTAQYHQLVSGLSGLESALRLLPQY
ncbi:hypothetical protein LWF01_03150 [Saxibacter everestensis]|uniref:Uncharacterized protein n=1 Tax=Saxibacter everestensis TaxID=2909229 RepID=A0ABY8QX93_9MICO|nr:hypothetical protein LWF01_03150 [Brevibacteriaceae bacterium ZFBP1038]